MNSIKSFEINKVGIIMCNSDLQSCFEDGSPFTTHLIPIGRRRKLMTLLNVPKVSLAVKFETSHMTQTILY